MRHLLAVVMSFLLVSGGLAVGAPSVLAYTPDNEELTFLALINDHRGQQGLRPMSLNMTLGEAADFHSQDMATTNYFEHTAPNGTTFDQNIRNFGYDGVTMGENIAAGVETAAEAFAMWQNSPEHNAGMLNPAFDEIGIGRYYDANSAYGWYWTTTFGGSGRPQGVTEVTTDGTGNGTGATDERIQSAEADTVVAEPEISVSEETGTGRVVETQQEVPGVANADGQEASATNGSGPVTSDGPVTTYDDINTGGVSGDSVNYDQSITPPAVSNTPTGQTAPPAETQAPPADQPASQQTTTTTTTYDAATGTVTDTFSSNIEEGSGSARELGNTDNTTSSSNSGSVTTDSATTEPAMLTGPETAPVTDQAVDPAAAPVTTAPIEAAAVDPAQAGMGCANYPDWLSAQTAYENAGGTAADPAFVNSLDPNWDGVVCEEMMVYQ